MWEELREYGAIIPGDVRVVVVRGEGRAFSAGLDRSAVRPDRDGLLIELAHAPVEAAELRIARFQEAFGWLRRPDLISVAAVQGHAIGAGFQLALACDLRILADDAQLSMAEVMLGLVPDLGGTGWLVELAGYARALELCATGRRVAAAEAERIGLANLVVAPGELTAATADLVAALLAAPRGAVTETKALIAGALHRGLAAQQAAERAAQVRCLRALAGVGD
jgi:enoyl-CoA hydratase/carnithine racemase